MAQWHIRHGKFWMLQWTNAHYFSLGIHIDPRRCHNESGKPFGPYMDIHFLTFSLSIGYNPIYTHGDTYRGTTARGGIKGCESDNCLDAPPFKPLPRYRSFTFGLIVVLLGLLVSMRYEVPHKLGRWIAVLGALIILVSEINHNPHGDN